MKRKQREITEAEYAKAARRGISRNRVYVRVEFEDWSIKDAITTPPREYRSKERILAAPKAHDPRGPINPASYYVAWQRGVGAEVLEHRIRELNWTPWEAATTPIGEVPKRPQPVV